MRKAGGCCRNQPDTRGLYGCSETAGERLDRGLAPGLFHDAKERNILPHARTNTAPFVLKEKKNPALPRFVAGLSPPRRAGPGSLRMPRVRCPLTALWPVSAASAAKGLGPGAAAQPGRHPQKPNTPGEGDHSRLGPRRARGPEEAVPVSRCCCDCSQLGTALRSRKEKRCPGSELLQHSVCRCHPEKFIICKETAPRMNF